MITRRLTCLLLVSTALSMPTLAFAAAAAAPAAPQAAAQEETEISLPGVEEIVVVGQRNITRATSQVVSVLSTADIARTGEGNIAGALSRVPGLSLVGNGYVYVRGLGDRYSLALLNGSPLPSPEPLKRVVPLDLFPSSIVSSSLVQKSYSVNFPGEFGGGVINLTTRTVPQEGFLSIGGSIGGDTETTGKLSYTYYGSKSDWSGYDNGNRDIPPALASFFASGNRISSGGVDTAAIASELVNSRNGLVQRIGETAPNFSGSLSAGRPFNLGGAELGVIGAAGYSNKWTTRDAINQTSLQGDLEDLESDFRRVTTDQRLVANGLLGFALDFGDNTVRWTNVYIHDTIKHARLGLGNRQGTNVDFQRQDTAWFERQLFNSQLVGEFQLTEKLGLDVRGAFANSSRKAPGELSLEYVRTNTTADPYGQYFVNRLNNGNGGDATISFSDLDEDLWSGGADAVYRHSAALTATLGYAYSDTNRTSSRRDFQFLAPNTFPGGVDMLRPDYLLQPSVIKNFGITLVESNEGNPAFLAKLRNHAGYLKFNGRVLDSLQYDVGVRYETAEQAVSPIQVFNVPGASLAGTNLDNSYWLPAATLTWEFRPAMQVRLNASKTIGRPQFRELVYQFYFDPDTDRTYRGNPLLSDSEMTNAEARYEWYFSGEQYVAVAGFYKRIKNPIEAFVSGSGAGALTTSFANAPEADLYGLELEAQKSFELADVVAGSFWADRRLVLEGNYTLSKSALKVAPGDTVSVFAASSTNATDYFRDGSALTGQSRHIANLQIGLENGFRLSQQTLMLNFSSKRVTSRGLANSGQPDVYEYPGARLDFVWREGIEVRGREVELKLEARNLTGVKYQEYQESGANRVYLNAYDLGRVITLSAQAKF
jgi:outer membrane receptor protein involved in Fe transport